MGLTKRWAGKVFGTNTGNVFLKLDGEDAALNGILRINEPGAVVTYNVQGAFEAPRLTLTGQPNLEIEGVVLGDLTASGEMTARGEIRGDWESTIGTGGTFHLFPHEHDEPRDVGPREHHTARHDFGAIEIERDEIAQLAESLRSEFTNLIVTVQTETVIAQYLDDFKTWEPTSEKADLVRIFAEDRSENRAVTIEFGQHVNWAMVQGADEAWVRGRLGIVRETVSQYERTYVTNFKQWGIGINQVMLLAAIVFLPSLEGLLDRSILMSVILALILGVNWFHSRYVPFSAIYLREWKRGLLGKTWHGAASWAIGIIAAVIATLAATYLEGALELSGPATEVPALESTPEPQDG